MADALPHSTPPSGKKRSHDGEPITHNTNSSSVSASVSPMQRESSPATSATSSSLTELTTSTSKGLQLDQQNAVSTMPDKKPKLTFAERQVEQAVKKREKEERAQSKLEEKAKKEEAKRQRDEEKRKKAEEKEAARRMKEVGKAEKEAARQAHEAERAEKQKVKEAEKAEKESKKAEKQARKDQKEAERLRKERAQLRIGAFFGAAPSRLPSSSPDDVSSGVSSSSSRRSSVASIDMLEPELDAKPVAEVNPEYRKWILPFYPFENTTVAPYNRFLPTHAAEYDDLPLEDGADRTRTIEDVKQSLAPSRRRHRQVVAVKELLRGMEGTAASPVDLTGDSIADALNRSLRSTTYKILAFREDIRPPYQGTYTRPVSPRSGRRLALKPTSRGLPGTDYDYDSEAEWQAPEEGDEDLDDEDEMSEDEDGVNDMADFLDDEGDTTKRKVTAADVEPISTGLCWEGDCPPTVAGIELGVYRLDVLHDDTRLPIDPFSTMHWSHRTKTTPTKAAGSSAASTDPASNPNMQPPRLPLSTVSAPNASPLRAFVTSASANVGQAQKENSSPRPTNKIPSSSGKKPAKQIPEELVPAFKAAIDGSDLNKIAVVEILKKQFPKCSKDAIKATLESVAVRQGTKEAEKRWVLIA